MLKIIEPANWEGWKCGTFVLLSWHTAHEADNIVVPASSNKNYIPMKVHSLRNSDTLVRDGASKGGEFG